MTCNQCVRTYSEDLFWNDNNKHTKHFYMMTCHPPRWPHPPFFCQQACHVYLSFLWFNLFLQCIISGWLLLNCLAAVTGIGDEVNLNYEHPLLVRTKHCNICFTKVKLFILQNKPTVLLHTLVHSDLEHSHMITQQTEMQGDILLVWFSFPNWGILQCSSAPACSS